MHAQHRQKTGRDVSAVQLLGLTVAGVVELIAAVSAHVGEGTAPASPIEIIRVGHGITAELRGGFIDLQQAVRIRIRQRLQEHAIHHAENRGIRPDAEPQCQHGDSRETRALAHGPEGIPKIVAEAGPKWGLSAAAQGRGVSGVHSLAGPELLGQ